jgi:hypothetical protein
MQSCLEYLLRQYVAESWLSRHARQAGKETLEEIMIHVTG